VVGSPLLPSAVAAIASRIAASGANIDRIDRLADRPVTCIELDVSGADPDALRAALTSEAVRQRVDVAVQRGGLHRRAMRLIVMDVDSTLVSVEVIDLLAARAGCAEQVAKTSTSPRRCANGWPCWPGWMPACSTRSAGRSPWRRAPAR